MSVSKENVLSALASVQWEGKDIVASQMVMDVTLSGDEQGTKVNLILEIEPKKNAALDTLKNDIEKSVKAIAGVSDVGVIFTAHKAAQGHAHSHANPHTHGIQKLELPTIKHIIAVASGKGGVGKSTTAVNLAAAFSQKGLKTGLMDADVYGPSIPRMLGLDEEPVENENGKVEPVERDGIKVMSMGFLVPEGQPMMWRGPMVSGAIMQFFKDVAWGDLDVLVIDMPPGTGDAQITLAQSIPVSGAVIVSTPQDIALLDARKALMMFKKTDVAILGIVENMSYFECPHCQGRSEIFGHGGAQADAQKLQVPFLGGIPLDISLRTGSDEGKPLTLLEPQTTIAQKYRMMADELWSRLSA
jgi:ATP-binding protein involved in chromosome partitioning